MAHVAHLPASYEGKTFRVNQYTFKVSDFIFTSFTIESFTKSCQSRELVAQLGDFFLKL